MSTNEKAKPTGNSVITYRIAAFFDLSYRDKLLDSQSLQETALEVKAELNDLENKMYQERQLLFSESDEQEREIPIPKNMKLSSSFFERRRQISMSMGSIACTDYMIYGNEVDKYMNLTFTNYEDSYSYLNWWKEKYSVKRDESGALLAPEEFPLLSILAAKHGAYRSTSCQPERNFSQLGILLDRLRQSLSTEKAARLLSLRLNKSLVNGISDILCAK